MAVSVNLIVWSALHSRSAANAVPAMAKLMPNPNTVAEATSFALSVFFIGIFFCYAESPGVNSKHEALISKQYLQPEADPPSAEISNVQSLKLVLNFEFLSFGFVSDFDIRYSDFPKGSV